MRSNNPALNENTFSDVEVYANNEPMTIRGTINRTFFLLALLVASAGWVWLKVMAPANPWGEEGGPNPVASVMPLMTVGAIAGLIAAIIIVFKKNWAPVLAPFYVLCQGLVLGCLSAAFEMRYPGIAIQAVGLTFGTLFSMLLLYKSRLLKVTDKFRMGIFAATGAVMLIYLFSWILSFFGRVLPFIHDTGPIGIGFSLIVVGIAAFNLLLDFDLIERAAYRRLPRYMEWYAAFGLMVTLIWLYMEILRLLSKLRDRR